MYCVDADYLYWEHCLSLSSGAVGFDFNYQCAAVTLKFCIADSSGTFGFVCDAANACLVGCVLRDSTSGGVSSLYGPGLTAINCLITGNGNDGILCGKAGDNYGIGFICIGNVLSDNSAGSGIRIDASAGGVRIFNNRITGNAVYGIEMDAAVGDTVLEDYNVIEGNGTARLNILAGLNSDDAPADDGFVNSAAGDYNVKTGAEIRSTAVILDWDA